MNGEGIVVAGGVRTSIGKFAGSFKDTPTSDLGATAIRAAVERAGISPDVVDEVILGCVGQVGEDAFNARLATLKAGLPEKTTVPEPIRLVMLERMHAISLRFSSIVCDGIADGSVRPVDTAIAAQMITGAVNAAAELHFFAPDVTAETVGRHYVRPLFAGLRAT